MESGARLRTGQGHPAAAKVLPGQQFRAFRASICEGTAAASAGSVPIRRASRRAQRVASCLKREAWSPFETITLFFGLEQGVDGRMDLQGVMNQLKAWEHPKN